MTSFKIVLCKWCCMPFKQYDDGKGTPRLYCDRLCRSAAHRDRNLASRQARGKDATERKGDGSNSDVVDFLINAMDGMAHEQMK